MEWTKEEVLDHINTYGFFASQKPNWISGLLGPSILTNPPLPGEIGLLLYTMSHSQLAQQPTQQPTQQPAQRLSQQQYTLQQNGSTECSRGVVMPKEELDETSKEETQADISGSRQVDSGRNQDQANDQEKLNPQDDDVIGPQASKHDPLPGLPTPAQSPEPQPNGTTALSVQVPPPQPPSARAPSAKAPPVQVPLTQAPSVHAPSVQAPSTQTPSIQAPSPQAPPVQAPSAQVPPAEAPPASPFSLTKTKEPRQPSLYKSPQPAQQSLPAATASTLPPATVPTSPSLPSAQYLYPSTANADPNMQLHIDQPTYDPRLPQNKTSTKAKQNDLRSSIAMYEVPYPPGSTQAFVTDLQNPQPDLNAYLVDHRYRQQYQNPPPIPPFRPPIS